MRLWKNNNEKKDVTGEITVFLQNWWGENAPLRTKTLDDGKTVVSVNGSFKVSKADVSQLKYFFGIDVPEGEFLQVQVGFYDRRADNFLKTRAEAKECWAFYSNNWHAVSFDKRDGSKGVKLECFADYWRKENFQSQSTKSSTAPSDSDVAFDDDNDLPF